MQNQNLNNNLSENQNQVPALDQDLNDKPDVPMHSASEDKATYESAQGTTPSPVAGQVPVAEKIGQVQ